MASPDAGAQPPADQPLAVVNETVLKKRKKNDQWGANRRERRNDAKARARNAKETRFKRAEHLVKEFRQQEMDLRRLQRQAKMRKVSSRRSEPPQQLLFVIRTRGTTDMHLKSRKILQTLRLRQIFNGVFLKPTTDTMRMLEKIQPFVTYGYPSLTTVSELIYKRGHAQVNRERTTLTDHSIVEQALGEHGIICIPDLISEIFNMGLHFKEATNFLWPFKLSPPSGRGVKSDEHHMPITETGNRAERINDLISQMN